MDQGNNGLSRGDRNRNARLAVLRAVLPRDHAVLGIDLAQSRQAAVLADHDSRVLARWQPRCSPWKLGDLLERALRKALSAGYAGITVACEPTGHRWMVIAQLAAERGIPMVCVQPLMVARAREAEDCTRGKSDDRDAGADSPAGSPAALLPAGTGGSGVGAAASSRRPPGPADRVLHHVHPAAAGSAGSRLAGGAASGGQAAGVGDVAGMPAGCA